MSDVNILQVHNLTKTFGEKTAVDAVSFGIKEGHITGFLGPNGAGKSTTMNLIMGFIKPTSGEVRVNNDAVTLGSPVTRRDIGFLSSGSQLDRSLTVSEEIEYFGAVAGGYDREYVADLVSRLKVDTTQRIGRLSTGNYQKVALIVALMHRPKLLILDEPTSGLDPLVQAEFNKIMFDVKATGATVFISSHILSEVEELCDDFIFIKNGKIAAQLTRKDLLASSNKVITVRTDRNNHEKTMKFLRENKIEHRIDAGNLDEIFMGFYGDDNA